ncbi:hypothetical protein [Paenibacillus sp. ATY16]|uniref:hypothetical protein n=1 Tax=Paenibacillus sp. ATY16 TaxID=1759312 RepID=UPI00200D877B|nr:hypothetical protein [Paenibacillus sp. ATY16]MCK9858207.1 hypothetical protein [Paenibacillus sp. ATY16]
MSRFSERFLNHPIHEQLVLSNTLINDISQLKNDPDTIVEIDRSKQVILLIQNLINNCDPNLIHLGYLDNINNSITQTVHYLNNYKNDLNVSHLHNMNFQLDAILPHVSSLLCPVTPKDVEGIQESIISFRASAIENMKKTEIQFKKLANANSELEQGVNQISATVDLQKNRFDEIINNYQEQFKLAEENRLNQFNEAEKLRRENFKARLDEHRDLSQQNENNRIIQFNDFKNNLEKELSQFKDKNLHLETNYKKMNENLDALYRKKGDTLEAQFQEKGNRLEEEYQKIAQMLLNDMEKYKQQAAQNLNMISVSGMAGGYKDEADKEAVSFDNWRRITFISMLILAAASIWIFMHPFTENTMWNELARKIFVVGAIVTITGYSARQAKIHLDAERKYRKMELELKALNPYLAELDDSKRKEVLEKMTNVFFGNKETENNSTEEKPLSLSNFQGIDFVKFIETLTALFPKK